MPGNLLFYGDNLEVLREHIKGEAIDLVYLDPPFNSWPTRSPTAICYMSCAAIPHMA
jgi:hypothetical protein